MRMSVPAAVLALVLALVLTVACSGQPKVTSHGSNQPAPPAAAESSAPGGEIPDYGGPKARIAVGTFACKAGKCDQQIGSGVADMLSTALFRSHRFLVLERGENLKQLMAEIDLSGTDYVGRGKGVDKGLLEGADIFVIGGITAFEPNAQGASAEAQAGLFSGLLGSLGGSGASDDAYISADIRLVDVRRGRVVNATVVEGQASRWRVNGAGSLYAGNVSFGAGGYRNTPMEKAVRVMLDAAVSEIITHLPESYFRYVDDTADFPEPEEAPPVAAPAPADSPVPAESAPPAAGQTP